jgi:hypothetical protein
MVGTFMVLLPISAVIPRERRRGIQYSEALEIIETSRRTGSSAFADDDD